jgi:hypothetical protein
MKKSFGLGNLKSARQAFPRWGELLAHPLLFLYNITTARMRFLKGHSSKQKAPIGGKGSLVTFLQSEESDSSPKKEKPLDDIEVRLSNIFSIPS